MHNLLQSHHHTLREGVRHSWRWGRTRLANADTEEGAPSSEVFLEAFQSLRPASSLHVLLSDSRTPFLSFEIYLLARHPFFLETNPEAMCFLVLSSYCKSESSSELPGHNVFSEFTLRSLSMHLLLLGACSHHVSWWGSGQSSFTHWQ